MRSAASEEQWTALRALREGRWPTYRRLAHSSGLNELTIGGRARREKWGSPDLHRSEGRAYTASDQEMDIASDDGDLMPIDGDLPHSEQEAGMFEMLKRQAMRMLRNADTQGKILNKAQVDTLASIIRVVEKQKTPAQERAEEKNTGDDAELGDILERIDRRILELAIGAARWMVETGDRRILG